MLLATTFIIAGGSVRCSLPLKLTEKLSCSLMARVMKDLLWRTFLDNSTFVYKHGSVRHQLGENHLMGNHNHGHPFLG